MDNNNNYNCDFTGIGKLDMDDIGDFILHTEKGTVNISNILDNIFASQLRPQVDIKIYKNGILLFDEQGGLFNHWDEQKVESYFVCGVNLSKLLFYNTEENLEISIKYERNIRNNGKKS